MAASKSEKFTLVSKKAIMLRLFMYLLTILLQSLHSYLSVVWSRAADDPRLQHYYPLWTRLFTVWTITMLITHAVVGIYCDVALLIRPDGKFMFHRIMRRFRNKMFGSIVWPSCWVCSILFWFFFTYDDKMLCKSLLNKVGSLFTFHLGHTYTLVAVLWEAFLQPRLEPKSHKNNLIVALTTVAIYIGVLCYTYITAGTWIYPFYNFAYGTVYFPLIHLITLMLTVITYYAQWPISRLTGFEHDWKKMK